MLPNPEINYGSHEVVTVVSSMILLGLPIQLGYENITRLITATNDRSRCKGTTERQRRKGCKDESSEYCI